MNNEAALSQCTICDGTKFGHGPSKRLSITNRLPHCETCHSLERHRIAHRVFNRLRQYTKGKRFLQFSPDPTVDARWFAEMIVSVWEGENSLDMQAIALPNGRYDWIYSSHVLNHVPDQAAALREMLRVVGHRGIVALSVGGTVFNYATRPSDRTFGNDYQFVLYGTEFADEVQAVLPDVAVLELVGVDPCTASIDSLYFYSRAEQTMREMAQKAVGDNIHVRVFPAALQRAAGHMSLPRAASIAADVAEAEPFAPCNICGSTQFRRGPSGRVSAPHDRLPQCTRCSSLERHRVMRRVFDALTPTFTMGKRLLQLGNEPGFREEWFDEVLILARDNVGVSKVSGLPAASYDWIWSSHLLGEGAEDVDALQDMLRVAGEQGMVALSVRGTTSRYETILALKSEVDLQRIRHHTDVDFVSELQRKLPDVALLELVVDDPCTASVDAAYFCSKDARLLEEMGRAAQRSGIFIRVFLPTRPDVASAQDVPWDRLRAEIEAWRAAGCRARFWIRDDDATSYSDELAALAGLCRRESVPLALAVIPDRLNDSLVRAVAAGSGMTVLQHGFDHRNRSSREPSSEFPDERPLNEALDAVRSGWATLASHFGDKAIPVFVPPWGTCSDAVRMALPRLGLRGFSGSQVGPFQPTELWRRGRSRSSEGLRLGSAHVSVNRSKQSDNGPIPIARHVTFLADLVHAIRIDSADRDEPIGIMTHAWGVDHAVRGFLRQLFYVTRASGGEWVSASEIFD